MNRAPLPAVGAHVDVLVVGAGLAGLAAGLTAAEDGSRVLVVERADAPGGAALLSMGSLWTHLDPGAYERACPDAEPITAAALRNGFCDTVDWLRRLGATLEANDRSFFGSDAAFILDVPQLVSRFTDRLVTLGGGLRYGHTVQTVTRVGPDGFEVRVDGACAQVVTASRIVLATGGIAANDELRNRLMGPRAGELLVRNHPGARGDGFRLAQTLGGARTGQPDGFYGHLVPWPLQAGTAITSSEMAQYHSRDGVLLDAAGCLLLPGGRHDHLNNQRALAADRPLVLLYDARTRNGNAGRKAGATTAPGRFAAARAAGAHTLSADTVADLLLGLVAWGIDVERAQVTVAADRSSLRQPPFRAVAVQPSITLADVGVRTDADMRVLDDSGRPIPGMFCGGADVGGTFGTGYAGGLAAALTLGRRAGRSAAAATR